MSEAVPSVVAIDIGTHKVSVLIGKVHAPDKIEVTGMAHARNRGMNKGKIVSLEKVVSAIKNAVQEAEDMAECRIHSAWVAIPSTELRSFYAAGRTPIHNTDQTTTTNELVRALELAKASHVTPDYYLASAVPLGFAVDDSEEWVQNPIGLSGHTVTGHYQLMMLPISTMQNLDKALKNAGIGVERMVISSLATAESTLLKDEKEYGVCLIDIGAGTTNITVYLGGHLAFACTLQLGGEHVTRDIAASRYADRMLAVFFVVVVLLFSRIELADIIVARYEEIFTRIYQELEANGILGGLHHGVVLTGDACQIEGAIALARRKLGVSAHLGNPPLQVYAKDELLPSLRRSLYATASGLLMFSQSELQQSIAQPEESKHSIWQNLVEQCNEALNKLKNLF
ncbi:hypothetical protein GWI33_009910 [Rhynchophorus ferrugineus]|uniref:SHS2 domain-containing protein n=1 Tax=Rhynchophorus ferrugineus TaxID=354439 RepID=A0A834ICR9_RHYFE|nr:hypothetical protein GWI33_009910 [Rhynchophorus ferrugineus]